MTQTYSSIVAGRRMWLLPWASSPLPHMKSSLYMHLLLCLLYTRDWLQMSDKLQSIVVLTNRWVANLDYGAATRAITFIGEVGDLGASAAFKKDNFCQ